MNDKWSRIILNRLIDKYERTTAFKNDTVPDKRIILNLYGKSKSDLPEYDIDNNFVRTEINKSIIYLYAQDLIYFEYFRGEENHIIQRVWLNFEKMEDVYRAIGRKSAKEIIMSVIKELQREIENTDCDWIVQFYIDTCEYIKSHYKIGNGLSEVKSRREDLYKVLRFINQNSATSMTERVFSERCFGDSKYFEKNLKNSLLSIMRRYISKDLMDTELLQVIGISKYPEQLEIRGSIIINSSDMGKLKSGFSVYSNEVKSLEIEIPETITRIVTIENRANYFAYALKQESDELVIYHGGHYSPAKKELFLKIKDVIPEKCIWYHWGDIDLGGFSMLLRLRKEIDDSIQLYRMSKSELEKYSDFTLPFNNEYAEKLKKLSYSWLLSDCHECIDYMLENKIKLEQEAMLT